MQVASVNGINIHYRYKPQPQLPLIVFSNSLGTDFRIWDRVIEGLEDKFQVLSYDKRGHGLSEASPPPYSIDDHIDDLAGLLDHIQAKQVIACGVSVGGMIVLGLAAKRPDLVRALILCDTAHKIGPEEVWNQRIEFIQQNGIEGLADAVIERWFSESFRNNRAGETAVWKNMLVRTPFNGYVGTCFALRDADLTNSTTQVNIPTLCLCGEEDQATPPELVQSLSSLIPDALFQLIEGAGHLPGIESPETTTRLILDFLRSKNIEG